MESSLPISYIRLFNLLKNKFGDKEAEEIVSLIKSQVDENFEARKDTLATKNDIAELKINIAKTETKLILWAFIFWATQLGAIFAFIKLLIVK